MWSITRWIQIGCAMLRVGAAGMWLSFVCKGSSESPGSATTHISPPRHTHTHARTYAEFNSSGMFCSSASDVSFFFPLPFGFCWPSYSCFRLISSPGVHDFQFSPFTGVAGGWLAHPGATPVSPVPLQQHSHFSFFVAPCCQVSTSFLLVWQRSIT